MGVDRRDFYTAGHSSSCCGADVIGEDFCSECREHCESIPDDPEEYEEWLQEKQQKEMKQHERINEYLTRVHTEPK